VKPAVVVLGWAGFNAVLAAIMFAYGESLEFIGLYFTAVLGTIFVGLVVLVAHRRRLPGRRQLAASSRSSAFLALAAVLFGLGFLYTHWISYLALFPLLVAIAEFRRERLPAGVRPVPTEVRTSPLVPERATAGKRAVTRIARVATVFAVAARALSALRRGRRR
jgi:hypothetical protein